MSIQQERVDGYKPADVRDLIAALEQAIEASGFYLSGPTDVRAAEHGEPAWVCNARAAIAQARCGAP